MRMALSILASGVTQSGFCGISGPACWNIFESCAYDYWCTSNPSNGPCPYDQLTLTDTTITGSITIITTLYISATMSFQTQSTNGNYTISNMEIIDVQDAQIMSTNVSYNFSNNSVVGWFLDLIHGETSVADNINKLVLKQLNNLTPKIISAINQELATLTFTL